jgi:hypothetical protein
MDSDLLYLDLKDSRERLCRSQVALGPRYQAHREMLQTAIEAVDYVGSYHCPQWSRFELPDMQEPS